MSFESFNLQPSVLAGVLAQGYTTPTPIQEQNNPGHYWKARPDRSGTDRHRVKRLRLRAPHFKQISQGKRGVLAGAGNLTHKELAEQICDQFTELGKKTGLRNVAIYGGVGKEMQIRKLRNGAEIAVGCPAVYSTHLYAGGAGFIQAGNPGHR